MKRLLLLLPMLVLLAPAPIKSQASSRAGVVVEFGDGSVQTRCVDFNDESISGLDLLQRSGVDVIAQTSGGNAAVCKIGPDGCNFPAESCLACKFGAGGQGEYWAYWQLVGDAWRYSQLGAGARRVRNGDVDGWAYGPGNVQTGAQPPVVTFEQICPALPPTVVPATRVPPTAVPATATAKPRPSATAVPEPKLQPTTPPTVQPTQQPTQAVVASAPTATPEPPTAVPPTETPTDAPTATLLPTGTAIPTSTATAAPQAVATIPAPPTSTAIAAGAVSEQQQATSGLNYVVFGVMATAVLGALGVALRRRPR